MVSTPFGLKFGIVSLCVVDQWVRSSNDLIKKRHKPIRPTARQEHLLSYQVSSISRNTQPSRSETK